MKLNKEQRIALAMWLGSKVRNIFDDHSVVTGFENFCDGEYTEWRVIYTFGMAGKIWNYDDRIYVTGYSSGEIGTRAYNKQQETIDAWNKEIEKLLVMFE